MHALKAEREESETVTAMAGLSMQPPLRYEILYLNPSDISNSKNASH